MLKNQLDFLVALQDIDIMIRDIEEVKEIGFDVTGREKLQEARDELVGKISKPLFSNYEKLKRRYRRPIVPVKDDVCLGCFMRIPTSLYTRGRSDQQVITCEGCGRILYWID
ncbi:MAG: zinc ribbon domain-containing protein [bacterium]